MKCSLCFSKALVGLLALGLASSAFTSVSHAQDLYWDPALNGWGSGGPGTWDAGVTANWGNNGTDVSFSSGANAFLYNGSGLITIGSGGVNPHSIAVWGDSGTTYTIGADGASDPIIFTPSNGASLMDMGRANIVFNAPILINIPASTNVWDVYAGLGTATSVTYNGGVLVGGGPNLQHMVMSFSGVDGSSMIFNGASINSDLVSTPPTMRFGLWGTQNVNYIFTANASFSGYSFEIEAGKLLLSTGNLGTGPIGMNNQGAGTSTSVLTAAPVTLSNNIGIGGGNNVYGTNFIGGSTADHSIFTGQINAWGNATLTAAAGGEVDFNGDIRIGDFKTGGAGTVVFGNPVGNEYNGTTEIQSGTLLIKNTSGSAFGNSGNEVALDSGATLGGTGISNQLVVAGGVTAIVAPGDTNSTGTLHLNSGLTASSGLTLNLDINGAVNDAIDFGTGPLTLGGSVIVNLNSLGCVNLGSVYNLFTGSGDWSASSPTFSLSAPVGYVLDPGYGGGQGYVFDTATHDLSVQFEVPEPSSYMMLLAGFALLAFVSRMVKFGATRPS